MTETGSRDAGPADSQCAGGLAKGQREARGGGLRRSLAVLAALAALGFSALIALSVPGGWRSAPEALARYKPWIVLVHLVLIWALWRAWPRLVERVVQRHRGSPALREFGMAMRGRVAVALLAIEMMVVMQWPFVWFW